MTSLVVGAVFAPIVAVLALPALSDVVSAVIAVFRRADRRARAAGDRAKLLTLVPAHNEGPLIRSCVESLQTTTRDRSDVHVMVLADNCADDTAAIAKAAGARVLERRDTTRRGKSHALHWALSQIPLAEYDAVVIIDADTLAVTGFFDALAAHGPLRDRCVQGYFGTRNPDDSWLARLGALLSVARYEFSYPLKERAGLNCPLTGNGMCIGTDILRSIPWPADALTENWDLYAAITARGYSIAYERDARLLSEEAPRMRGAATQRRRWLAGRFLALREYARRIVTSDRIGWRQKLDCLAELTSPGPVLTGVLAASLALVLWALPGWRATVLAIAAALSLAPTLVVTALAGARAPDKFKLLIALLGLPLYAVWRVGVAVLSFRTGSAGVWERSPRNN